MGSGSSWGMIIGFVVGAALAVFTGGASLWTSAMFTGAAIGGAIGGIAGGIIDPMEFPNMDSQAQRLEEIQLMGVTEGTGVVKAYGNQIRIAGQLIAVGSVNETKHVSSNPTGGGGKKSFLAGTLILLGDGTTKPIEDIVVGDVVRTAYKPWWSRSMRTRKHRVTKLWNATTKTALKVELIGHKVGHKGNFYDAFSKEFCCTPEHDLYILKQGRKPEWMQARSLRVGDFLLDNKMTWIPVVGCNPFDVKAEVYNLTVAKDHNYFASGVLVKNKKGGGGGGGGSATWYTYDTDVVIAIQEGPIHKVEKVYMNGKKKYFAAVAYPVEEGVSSITGFNVQWLALWDGVAVHHAATFQYRVTITATGGGAATAFDNYVVGQLIATSDSSGANWNGESDLKILEIGAGYIVVEITGSTVFNQVGATYDHTIASFGGDTHSVNAIGWNSHPDVMTLQTLTNQGAGTGAKVTSTSATFNSKTATDFRFYIGDDGDPLGTYGLGTVTTTDHNNNDSVDQILLDANADSPKYKGIAYCAVEGLQLGDYGNQIPQIQFAVDARPREPEVNASTVTSYATLGQVIDTILIRQGRYKEGGVGGSYVAGDDFNTDAFQAETVANRVRGFTSIGIKTAQQLLSTLVVAYDLIVSESDGVLLFSTRDTTSDITVLEAELGAYANPESSSGVPLLAQSDKENSDLPNEVNVDYYNVDDNYQRGSQKARKSVSGPPRTQKIEIPLGLTPDEAQTIANRVLYQAHQQRKRCSFTLPPKHVTVQEGDLVALSIAGEGYSVRVLELNRGADFTHEVAGVIEGSESVDYTGDADSDPVSDVPYTPPPMRAFFWDSPTLHAGGLLQAGHYLAACTLNEDQEFISAEVYRADVIGGPYTLQQTCPTEGMMFTVATAIPDGPVGVWDTNGTFDAVILGPVSTDAPVDTTEALVLAGESFVIVGGEVIGFKDVSNIGRTYTFTNLIRGRRGTEKFVSLHSANEVGCVVSYADSAGIVNLDYLNDKIGTTKYYKVVAQGETASDVTPVGIVAEGNRVKPFPVGNVRGYKATDWIVDFVRRDRAFFQLFSETITPNTDGTEIYTARIYDVAAPTVVVRTLSSETDTANGSGIAVTQYDAEGLISANPQLTYDAADLSADGLASETSLIFEIFKVGSFVLEGETWQITITDTRDYWI